MATQLSLGWSSRVDLADLNTRQSVSATVGDIFDIVFTVVGTAVDVSTWQFEATLAPDLDSAPYKSYADASFGTKTSGGAFTLSSVTDDTSTLPGRSYAIEVRRVDTGHNVVISRGYITLSPSPLYFPVAPPSGTVRVDQGGTGVTSLTAYAVLCGGTGPTEDVQQVAGVGTSGQVLMSAGAGTLPSWQTAPTNTGPQGATGPAGADGADGPQGATGPAPSGATGDVVYLASSGVAAVDTGNFAFKIVNVFGVPGRVLSIGNVSGNGYGGVSLWDTANGESVNIDSGESVLSFSRGDARTAAVNATFNGGNVTAGTFYGNKISLWDTDNSVWIDITATENTVTIPASIVVNGAGEFGNGFTGLAVSSINILVAANTIAEGFYAYNPAAATSGNQRYSPAISWIGQGWKTDAAAGSQQVEFRSYCVPVQGTAAPTGILTFDVLIAGGGRTTVFTVSSAGVIGGCTVPASLLTGTLGADHGGTGVANNAASTITISGNFGTTFTVTGTTSVTLPTSGTLATTAYVDAAVVGLLDLKGSTNCSANPNYPAASKGDTYVVSAAGKIGGASGDAVKIGDMFVALADNAGGTKASVGTSWQVLEGNIPDLATIATTGAISDLVGAGTGVLTALGVNVGSAGSFVVNGGALGTPSSGNLASCTFPTLNQNTSGSAASLSVSGQTGLVTIVGLASTSRAKTVRDAADTILELGGSYTPTGTWTSMTFVTPALGTPASGVLTNCTGLPSAGLSDAASAATASVVAKRDANGNCSFVNVIEGYTTTATAAGTTTLTVSSNADQYFTGSTTQTCTLPVASTLVNGQAWWITNNSTGAVTVQTSGGNTLIVLPGLTSAVVQCIDTSGGTGTASWKFQFFNKRAGKQNLALSNPGATPTINTDLYESVTITGQTADITSFTTNLSGTPGNDEVLRISITGTAARALTFGSSFEASTIALPTTTVTTNRLDIGFVWNAATSKWRCTGSA